MTGSAITKEDYANNPQAVLEVLEFYTDQTKRNEAEYGTATLVPGALPLIPSDSEGDRWANLMPRQQPTPPSSRPDRPQRPERPDRPEDQLRPSIPERSQSVDILPVTQRMSSLNVYDDRVSPHSSISSRLRQCQKGSFPMYWVACYEHSRVRLSPLVHFSYTSSFQLLIIG